MEEAAASTRNRHSHGDENSDESKDTVSSNHPGQRRRRRTVTKSRSTGTRTGNGHRHGALSDATARNINAFDGFKLKRLLQSSDLRLGQHHQQRQLPAINTTQPHGQYSSPTTPSSYDPTRSMGPPVLSPIGSGSRRAVSVSGPDGVRVLEPSFPRESLLHKVIVQTTDGEAETGDASTMSPMASPASQNNAVSVRVHKTSKPLSHQADPSSLAAIAELSRRYYAPPRTTKRDVALQFAAHGIGASSPKQQSHSNPRQPSLIEVGSPIDTNLKSVFSSPPMISRERVDQYQDMNGIESATEDADDAFAIRQQNQDGRQTATRSIASLGALARKTFVKGKRFALSRHFNLPTKHNQEPHMRSREAPEGDPAKNLDMIVTTTNTTPSTVDESDELSMISLSPRLATQTSRNSGIAHQRQEIENHCDRAAFERGAEFILQLGHLLGKTCTTLLTPHTRKRRPRHESDDDDDDDDRSAASSLSSIAPRIIVPVASMKNGQQGWRRGTMLCVIFALSMAGICAFMIGTDAILSLSIIAARKRMFHVSKAEDIVVPKQNLSAQMHTARTRVSVLEPPRDKMHGDDKEMELHHDEAENNFVELDVRLASAKENQQDTAKEREEELRASSDDTFESHVVAAEESPENEKVRVFLTKGKNYNEFVSLQKLLEAIYSHKLTKPRALLRRSRALLAPPFWHLPGTFVVSVPSNNITIPADVIGTMSRALVYVPSPGALTPVVTMDVSSSTVSTYAPSPDDDFSDLYYQTLYNEHTCRDQDFDRPLSQLLGDILQEYRREKRRRNIEQNRFLAITDQDDGVSTRTVTKRTKNPLYQIAKWLKNALPSAL